MDVYNRVAFATSKLVTERYSTSFSLACRLLPLDIRRDIYGVYGLVRLADEIVDSYRGADQLSVLDRLEQDTYTSLETGYSSNLIIHAFVDVARRNLITPELIKPFFASMRQDITQNSYDQKTLDGYIYGSAEVVGLMCLRIFVKGDEKQYEALKPGAQSLGAAFQKVNFLRDLESDHDELGRMYFPGVQWASFDETQKKLAEHDIHKDFTTAADALSKLPPSSRPAVTAAYRYYLELLKKIEHLSATELKSGRVRISDSRKLVILAKARMGQFQTKVSH